MTLPVVFTANGPSGYNLTNSLRFRSSASAYLSRTPASASGQNQWTFSTWVKRGIFTASQFIIGGNTTTSGGTRNILTVEFGSDNTLQVYAFTNASGYYFQRVSSAVYRDPSAWYHLVVQFDPDNGTSANRIIAYINGQQVSWGTFSDSGAAGSISSSAYRSINNTYRNDINGGYQGGGAPIYFGDGYLAETIMVSGSLVSVSSFGETSTSTGVWIPKKYTGTYGTNGFYLPFTDNSALTTSSNAGLGKDFSGNSNYWTTNNISITAGTTYDSMTDVPTLTSATAANYAVLNPLQTTNSATAPTNGNLTSPANAGAWRRIGGSMQLPTTGKFYFEYICDSFSTFATFSIGVFSGNIDTGNNVIGTSATEWGYNGQSGYATNNNSNISSGFTTATTGDVLQLAYDASTGSLWFGKNNTWQGASSPNPSTGTSPTYTGVYNITPVMVQNWATQSANFGQRPFAYTPPTGFVALNTFNLPTPTIGATASSQANKYMNIALYTGTGSSLSVTGVGFQPDWTWIKGRSGATDHGLYDAVRGVQKQLESNNTDAETTETTGLTAFGSDGFTVGALAQLNTSSATYVAWNWKANGAGSTNTAGSITSTVSANTTAGFSVVTYTGNGSNSTVGHGLGVAPSMVIVKCRSTAGESWHTYHVGLSSPANTVYLNGTAAQSSFPTCFNSMSTLNSTVFSLGTDGASNGSGRTYVAYCFAPIAGYSAFGSYVGNDSADGTFIYTGFRPAFVLYKKSNGIDGWLIYDSKRNSYNVADALLQPNTSGAEAVSAPGSIDIVSNGFKQRNANNIGNSSSFTYIYMAFAENPFKYANAR
jgi:hypothetical protein